MPKGGPRRNAGRKRKPPRLKILEGNPGKRPIDPGLELPPGAPPEPHWPSLLPGRSATRTRREAQREWRWIVPELDRTGILAHADRNVLVEYCVVAAELTETRRRITVEGPVLETTVVRKNGDEVTSVVRNPLAVTVRELRQVLNTYRSDLGLTPAARARLHPPRPEQADDDERDVFGS